MGVNWRGFGMSGQYNFSQMDERPATDSFKTVLAIDTGSPVVSVAISIDGEIAAESNTEARHSSSRLLEMIDDCLGQAGIEARALDLLVGVRGPGSFTGLRVGLATLQGMRMALGIQASTITTFQVLASLSSRRSQPAIACVDALRDKWMTQEFDSGSFLESEAAPQVWSAEDFAPLRSTCLIGFGISRLGSILDTGSEVTLVEPGPLASRTLSLLSSPATFDWRTKSLSRPLYLSPPAVSRPLRST